MNRTMLRRAWWIVGYGLVAAIICLSLMRDAPLLPNDTGGHMSHMLAYAVVMAWFAQIELSRPERARRALMLAALAIGLEFLQGLTSYRHFDVRDMVAGILGVASGWLLAPPRVFCVAGWLRDRLGPDDRPEGTKTTSTPK